MLRSNIQSNEKGDDMKRCLYLLFYITIGLIFLVGCGKNSNSAETTDWEHEDANKLEGVTMFVKEGSVSPTGLMVIFENTSDKRYTYGDPFLLEEKSKGSWHKVSIVHDANYGFNDIGYELAPADISEWAIDWEWLYGKLKTGEYRIAKDLLDVGKPGDYDTYHLTAEFTIN